MVKYLFAFLYAIFNATGSSIIKQSLKGQTLNSFGDYARIFLDLKVIGGFAIIFLSVLAMFKLLTISKFSFAIPVSTAMNFIITIFFSVVIFNEKPNWSTFVGATVILLGIAIYTLNKTN